NVKVLSDSKSDVVISLFTNISILISLFGKVTSSVVAAEHGQYFAHGFFIRLMRRVTYRKVDAVVALTTTDAAIYSKLFGGKGRCIPNGISGIPKEKSTGKTKRLIAVGRLVKEKGFDTLIVIAGSVLEKEKGWSLALYGDGYEREKLTRLIDANQSRKRITLPGFEKNVARALAGASIYLCTSRTESFGMAIAEGMACALPVVSFDCPTGPRDIIEDGVNGFLVPVGDNELFADRVCLLMRDDKLRIKMGRAARKSVERFLPGRIATLWDELLDSLVEVR
ncbi:MAG TPA: glycosyltransferase family 4 protein, partial [Spirochaetota bacterium]